MNMIIKPLDVFLKWALVALAITMIMTVTWQVFSRYALRAPSSLTEEVARFQLIWLGLLGAVYTFRNRMHVGIDVLVTPLKGRARIAVELASLIACAVFAVLILIYGGSRLVGLTYELNQTSAALGIRMAYVYAIIPISGLLICIYSVHFMLDALLHGKVHEPSEVSVPTNQEGG